MLAQDCVRKLTLRCGSRFGASRSAIRTTPPRLGCWAMDGVARRTTVTSAATAGARHRAMTDPPLLVRDDSVHTDQEGAQRARKVAPLSSARLPCQCAHAHQ